MDDPLKQICDGLGVCREEALFYLEGFHWDLDAAMEACRNKTLPSPSLTVQPSSEIEKAAAEEHSRNQKIKAFCDACGESGATVDDAKYYLSKHYWNIDVAANKFYEDNFPTESERKNQKSSSQMFSNDGGMASDQLYLQRFSGGQTSKAVTSSPDFMQDVLSKLPDVPIDSLEGFDPEFAKAMDPTHLKEEVIRIFTERATGASLKAAIDCLNYCQWNVEKAIKYYFGGYRTDSPGIATAQVVKNFKGKAVGEGSSTESLEHIPEAVPPMDSSQVTNLNLPSFEESAERPPQNSQTQLDNEKIIASFLNVAVDLSREEAIAYLDVCDWNLNQAADNFIGAYSLETLSAAKIRRSTQNRDLLRLPAMGLPSQSQFEASYVSQSQGYSKEGGTGSSPSSISAGPTETQRSLEEAGEGNVTVAIPGMASSQVDGKAVEEGSSTETFPDPFANQDRTTVGTQTASDAITITLQLADGTMLDLTFRSNQTLKDIRNAIHERAPDNDRNYYLLSVHTGDEYRDLNTTVHKISTRGSTTLLQIFLDQ